LVPFPLCFVHGSAVLVCVGEPPVSPPLLAAPPPATRDSGHPISIQRAPSTQATKSKLLIPVN
jgi:hypothetical protein